MKITFAKPDLPEKGTVVVGILSGNQLTASAEKLDAALDGGLKRAIRAASRFDGKKDQSVTMLAPGASSFDRILAVGLGEVKDLDALALQGLGGGIYAALAAKGVKQASILVDPLEDADLDAAAMAAEIAFGARLRSYRFDKYLTKEKPEDKPALKTLRLLCDGNARARKTYADLDKVADGVFLTRDLVSEPANVLYPEALAKRIKEELEPLGVAVEILGEKEMRKLGMGSLLAVGQGSERESQLVVMQWNGTGKTVKGKGSKKKPADLKGPLAFIGKGVTFDSGGISIKPSAGMEDMKWDMGGAGVVAGLMKALAGRKAAVDAVGIVGLVENMPSGSAQRPGDIVTSMSGQTIEVLNTDAEGRLVLADALHYCNERFKPRFMIDLATLTGAIIVALGHEKAGLFTNDDQLSEDLVTAADDVGEYIWRLPLGDAYDKMLKSDAADVKNISGGGGAGSITAAQFLKRFVGDTTWAHLDIAGVTWAKADKAVHAKGGTGFGVRLLDRLVANAYEGK